MKQLTSYNRVAGYLNKIFDLLNEEFHLMSSCQLMFLGVRSSLEAGFGLKPPASSYLSYFYSSFKTSPSIQHH